MTVIDSSNPAGAGPRAAEGGRARILRVAAELFLAHGYAETSLRTIADAVEMRPASIYHHFTSKDALLAEILTIGMDAVTTAFETAAASLSEESSGQDRLRAHVEGHLQALFANQAFTAAHVTVFPFVPDDVRALAVPQRDAYEHRWTELLETISGDQSPEALRLTRLALLGAMNSSLQWFDPTEGAVEDLANAIVSTLWVGLGALQRGDPR